MSLFTHVKTTLIVGCIATITTEATTAPKDFDEVNEGFTRVVSTVDGQKPLFDLWINKKENQLLAELPQGWDRKKFFIAVTPSAGVKFAGLQGRDMYVYFKRYGDRIAIIEPETSVRSTGDKSSKDSVDKIFTDSVLIDMSIVANGPNGQPVIDLDELLVNNASKFAGPVASGVNSKLMNVTKAKSFPKNLEVAVEMPTTGGKLKTIHYSISEVPEKGSYKPRLADERVGYFTTSFRDLGQYHDEDKWVRYVNRWDLQKRDSKLTLSPPKEPIVFYIEHTVPVRYRRWVRDGVLFWNNAFEEIGIDNAIEVYYQDAATGAHMEKDPEDVRYNFLRWLHNDVATAIGPSRAHPMTGEILDADIVLTDGWIRAYWRWYNQAPFSAEAMSSFNQEDIQWLEDNPSWDPRIRMASPIEQKQLLAQRENNKSSGDYDPSDALLDPILAADKDLAEIAEWLGDENRHCLAAYQLANQMAFARLGLEALNMLDEDEPSTNDRVTGDELDGIPEWFIGPLMSSLVCHEVGHTLGLRHNFKASGLYTLEEINSEEIRGQKPFTSSVMDYNPVNFNMDTGDIQGDFAMIGIGPYDYWAIEYGYTSGDTKEVLQKSNEPEHAYMTDEDTGGPDPLAKRYDFSKDPLTYANNQMRIINKLREGLLDSYVQDGESWSKARRGYETTLRIQVSAASMMSDWIGGAHTNRNKKGDFGEEEEIPPVIPVSASQQRAALTFVIDNIFNEDAYGLTPELLSHFNVDKWFDDGGDSGEATWPIHDRILGTQASLLSAVLAPSRLRMVYDNEFRVPSDEDALTVAEIFDTLMDSIYAGLNNSSGDWTVRNPMISSLQRNLQAEMVDRLIDLSTSKVSSSRTVSTLALYHTKRLYDRLGRILRDAEGADTYSQAHLQDMHERLGNALDVVYTM